MRVTHFIFTVNICTCLTNRKTPLFLSSFVLTSRTSVHATAFSAAMVLLLHSMIGYTPNVPRHHYCTERLVYPGLGLDKLILQYIAIPCCNSLVLSEQVLQFILPLSCLLLLQSWTLIQYILQIIRAWPVTVLIDNFNGINLSTETPVGLKIIGKSWFEEGWCNINPALNHALPI